MTFASEIGSKPSRVKVVNPMASMGPSMKAEILSSSDTALQIRLPKEVLVGSTVMVRTPDKVMFGEVRFSEPSGAEFEIGVQLQSPS